MTLLERDKINRAEGYKEGFIEGFEEVAGIERINELKEISYNLVSMGFSEDKIAEIIGIPVIIVSHWLCENTPEVG